MSHPIHIVTRFSGIGGCETHAVTLAGLLRRTHTVSVWSDQPTEGARKFGATPISLYSRQLPEGGTLILLGTHFEPGRWLDYAKPRRLIVLCVLSHPDQLFAALAALDRPTLPKVELAFISSRLRDTMGLPGRIALEPMDLERFAPRRVISSRFFTIGRHSRDAPEKHHPLDPSLYRMLAWKGIRTRLLGGSCLSHEFAGMPEIEALPAGSTAPEAFLNELDVFFYRTSPAWAEPSGRVVMEALACGLPVIAHESGGYTDWIEQEKNGFVFSTQEQAHDLICQLARNPGLARALGIAARASAESLASGPKMDEYLTWLTAA
jgi:hypothetical protein